MIIRDDIKSLADYFYNHTAENNEVYYVKWLFPNNELPDLSLEKAEQDYQLATKTLETVRQLLLDDTLSHYDEIILKVLEYYCGYIQKNYLNYWHIFDLNHYRCPLAPLFTKLKRFGWDTPSEKEKYLDILAKFPRFLQDMKQKMQLQSEKYIRMPVESGKIVLKTLDQYCEMVQGLNRGGDSSAICEQILEKLQDIGQYIRDDYLPYAPQTLGFGQYPGGMEMYLREVETYISSNKTPLEIQQAGFEALEKTKNKMRDVIKRVGFSGTLEEFAHSVQNDERFKFKNPEEMQKAMCGYLDKIRPLMSQYFNRMPQADCAVARIDPKQEGTTSWGYYNIPVEEPIGIYYYSAAELDKRCQIRNNAIVYHELLPGHHYQMNLVLEDETLPDIIHHHYNTACADGWAEYASGFCEEIGLYDLYNEYGRLTWDAFLCCRLIVDTGLNALGWTLERAKAFIRENTMLTDREIYSELLRYTVAMPAQALSYKWGSIKFFGFKEKAVRMLGDKFDIKEFHDVLLEFGSIPLDIMEEHFEWYLRTKMQ